MENKSLYQVTIRNNDFDKSLSVILGFSILVKLTIFIMFDSSESKFGHMKKFSDGKIIEGYEEGFWYHIKKNLDGYILYEFMD